MDNEGPERHEGGSARLAGGEPTQYVCTECRRTFSIPPGAAKQTDEPEIDGLWCPWCTRWAVPVGSELPTHSGSTWMRRSVTWAIAIVGVGLVGVLGYLAWAEREGEDSDPSELASALKNAPVSLEQGLALSEQQGTPISAKFEVEDEVLQLSVYMLAGAAFSEVILDPRTGKVMKVGSVAGGDDLKAAEAQADVITKATVPLRAAVERMVKATAGSRAVSVTPRLREGHPVAEITLLKGETFKVASEKLD